LSRLFFVTLPSNNRNLITAFKVDVKVSQSYTNENGGKTGGKVGGDVPSLSQALSQVLSPDEERDASIDAKDATSSSKVASHLDNPRQSQNEERKRTFIFDIHMEEELPDYLQYDFGLTN